MAVNGQTTVPFALQQLAQMAQSGQFAPQSQVWKQGVSAGGLPQERLQNWLRFSYSPPPSLPPSAS
ncbi:MAG: DUF4339 domain-containing protein [Treponema sp.]|nr:DUF4339 domain-containing protein [Treponema sp.]